MTDGLAYLAAIALALVFAYSGVTKLRNPLPAKRAIEATGLPAGRAIAKSLPYLELLIAVGLLVRPAAVALGALALLAVFTLFIAFLLSRDIDVSCGCFGAGESDSVSSIDILRNGLLIVLAVVATTTSRPSGVSLEEVILATTFLAIGAVVLAAFATRQKLGQLFGNELPGGL